MTKSPKRIAFQGVEGANSHLAAERRFPDMEALPCDSFDQALNAVIEGAAEVAMIPIENSSFGRVADIHILLPDSGLFIIDEQFEPIRHMLMAPKGVSLSDIKTVHSHPQALGQCRENLKRLNLTPETEADTAGAAKLIANSDKRDQAALASSLAAEVYGLDIIREDMQDNTNNTTRFVVLSRTPNQDSALGERVMTSFMFEVKNVPAALFKSLGGFATNGVNMTKLESYYDPVSFQAAAFYAEIEGRPGETAVDRAMEELDFHTKRVTLFGSFNQARVRQSH